MIRLDPRLTCAFNMLQGFDSVADIGSDHGKLTAALLLNAMKELAGIDHAIRLIPQNIIEKNEKTRVYL